MRNDDVEIEAFIRRDMLRAIAIWDGTLDDQGAEVWTWLPKSLIEYNPNARIIKVRMPDWLAREKALAASVSSLEAETARLKAHIKRLEGRLTEIELHLGLDQARH